MKVSSDGEIEWTKVINVATDPYDGVDAEYISTGISVNSAVLDDEENIYFSGNMRATMYVDAEVINPHNVEGWNGDSQKSVGNGYIIKLDHEGNYVNHVVTEGLMTSDNVRCMTINDNRLYLIMQVIGTGEANVLSFAGSQVNVPENTCLHLVGGCLDTDLNGLWLTIYPNTLNKTTTIQVPQLKVVEGCLWLAAEGQYGMTTIGEEVNTGTLTRDGFLFKFNKDTGESVSGMTIGKGWAGVFDVLPCDAEHVYAAYFIGLNAPAMLAKVSINDLAIDEEVQLCSSTATAQNCIIHGNRLYVMLRLRSTKLGDNYNDVALGDYLIRSPQYNYAIGAFELPSNKLLEDVNNDGIVNVADVNIVLNDIFEETNSAANDVNNDGQVNVADVNIVLNYILNQSSE